MGPGILLILVLDLQTFEVGVEGPVLAEEEVFGPAVDPHRGDPAVVHPLDDPIGVIGAALGRLAEDPLELGADPAGLLGDVLPQEP